MITKGNQKIARGKQKRKQRKDSTATGSIKKFVKTNNPYSIASYKLVEIGKDMLSSAATFLAQFGDPIRDFTKHCHHLKAAEWKTFTLLLVPTYMKH